MLKGKSVIELTDVLYMMRILRSIGTKSAHLQTK